MRVFIVFANAWLVFLVADVLLFRRIESKVADWSNQTVDAERDARQEDVATGSWREACGLQGSVIDNDTTNPSQEEREQKANKILVFHKTTSPIVVWLQYMLCVDICQVLSYHF